MRALSTFVIILLGLAVLVALNSVFMVDQRQQALVVRVGNPIHVYNPTGVDDPGLKFKVPLVDQVVFLDKRNLFLDVPEDEITAGDSQRLTVDSFARWRISDPLLFFQRVRTEDAGRQRISDILVGSTREVLGTVPSQEIISGQRAALMDRIRQRVAEDVSGAQLGVEIVDVRIKRVELPAQNREQVFARMVSERQQQATGIRAEGNEAAARIRAEADREARVIQAQANEQDQRIRGAGDARRNEIYAEAYNLDPEFFAFYRSMEAYENSIEDGTTVILSPNSDFFRYFRDQDGRGDRN